MNDIRQTNNVPIMEKKWFIGGGPLGGTWKDSKIKLDSTFGTLCHYFA